jgi:glutathione S-transferase
LGVADVYGEEHGAIIADAIGLMPVKVRLYTIPGSHPGVAAQLMLAHKGIPFKRTDLFPVISKLVVRGLRFPKQTVPAMKIDGRRVQGSREIARELEQLRPEPALFPADPAKRAEVEEAERFGDEELQHPVRQMIWWAFKQDRSPLRSFSEGAKLGIPIGIAVRTAAPIVALSARFNEATDENVRADLAAFGGLLQRVDELIAAGTLNGEELNVADFQIAPSIRLAMTFQDLRPLIEARPAGQLAKRVQPEIAGDIPPVFPPAWLEPLRGAPAATV